jgi:uncharacterized YccA/Bax inhibitor family protein
MKSGNPALNSTVFSEAAKTIAGTGTTELMTLEGTSVKAGILGLLVAAGASYTWQLYFVSHSTAAVMPWLVGGSIAGFLVALITIFNRPLSPYTSPIYAVLEGLALGGLSAIFDVTYPGIVVQAVALTFAILAAMLLIYTTRLIQPSENFKLGVVAATGGIAIYYLIALVLGFFGIQAPLIWDSGPLGIAFSVFVVIIASLNLVIDFDFIEQGVKEGAPRYMEWYGAFGLVVTLVWLYLELLRLLAKTSKK